MAISGGLFLLLLCAWYCKIVGVHLHETQQILNGGDKKWINAQTVDISFHRMAVVLTAVGV